MADSMPPFPRAAEPAAAIVTRSSLLLFVIVLVFNLTLVVWWTSFLVGATHALEAAGELLIADDVEAAAKALGAHRAADLPALARARRRMFVSEGAVFTLIVLAGGLLTMAAVRREARLRQDQDRFLAGATHELKTPLATITLLLESLQDGRVPAEKRDRWLRSGLIEAQRLERGLQNVLTAAGLRTTGKAWPSRQRGDLAADVRQALQALAPRAEAAGVELRPRDLPSIEFERDPAAVQLVLHNLLDNAVKYSPSGSRVDVSLASDGDDVELCVADSGRGMDTETLQHAFDPFWRGRDPAAGGTGLGLHLVQQLVRAHGGSVQARSAGPGKGSSITVRLPLRGRTTNGRGART